MFCDRLTVLAETGDKCTILTPFGQATGKITFCDEEEVHFHTAQDKHYRLYCIDILGLEEFPTVPSE